MTITTRPRSILLPLICSAVVSVTASPGQGGGASTAGLQWTGTVTVTRQAAGSMKSDDGKSVLGFTGAETITFRLGPDGVASYDATYRSNVDFGGQYSVPTVGSGSGTAYYGVDYNGSSWQVVIDGGDDFSTDVNHTAEDLWWAHQFRDLIKLADAVAGSPSPPYSGRVEKGGRGVNGSEFASPGAATATTLSGSHTERSLSSGPEGLDGLPAIPMTLTVIWNLTRGPVQPKVSIHGPDCGCLDAKTPESTPLTFRAGSTTRGGEFSEFEIVSEGRKPEIVSNEGGERPELVLTGTKDTAAVTLRIHYLKNGKRYDAPPRRVEFCTLEEIELKDDERDLAFDGTTLAVDAGAKAWYNGEKVSHDVTWELEKMEAPTTQSSEPASAKAEKIKFTYEGLPEKNDSFGPKSLTATIARGSCSCAQRQTIHAFFVADDSTHPGDDSPNWYYYWRQSSAVTAAARSSMRYQETIVDPNLPDAHPIARYDPESQKLLISGGVHIEHGCRGEVDRGSHTASGRQAEGIDCFGETVRHEWQHRQDAINWWGSPAGPYGVSLPNWFTQDWDHDQVPNAVEDHEPGCQYGAFVSMTPSGGRQTWFTCANRPFGDATDAEINAYWAGWTWPIGTVDGADWSCGPLSKQWHGRSCGQ